MDSFCEQIVKKIKGETRINESSLKEMMREVKLALLEADVNYKVVKEFIANIETKGYNVSVEETDSGDSYQIIIKVNKNV